MKQIHTLFSLLLCLVLLFSLAPMALAEEESLLDEAALDQWIQDYLKQQGIGGGNQLFSVGFCYTATGDAWYYNGDSFMYSASMYKVPVAMLLAEKEASGLINQDTDLGGGTLRYLESTALTFSNNDSGHAMLNYLGEDNSGKASRMCMKYASLDEAYYDPDFFEYSYYSARFITQVMQTLCAGGEERFPHVIENLLIAQPDSYLNLSLMGKFQVAQKYGAFQERNGNSNNHITAIVYTPNPIIVTVMTRNVNDFQQRMADIGEYLANYALELDGKLQQRQQAQAQAEAQAAAEAAAQAEQEAQSSSRISFTGGAQIEGGRARLMPALYILWAAIAAFGVLVLLHAARYRKTKAKVTSAKRSRGTRGRH